MNPLETFALLQNRSQGSAPAPARAPLPDLSALFQRPTITRPVGPSPSVPVPVNPGFGGETNYFPQFANLVTPPAPVTAPPVEPKSTRPTTGGDNWYRTGGGEGGAGRHDGGPIPKLSGPGEPAADVPMTLQEGEYVMTKEAVEMFGMEFFERINAAAAGDKMGDAGAGASQIS